MSYKNPDRLADVLALIQVLALHAYRHRTEQGLTDALRDKPTSATSWVELAKEHPEFFRVDEKAKFSLSLIATHVLPKDDEGNRKLPDSFVTTLLQSAITLNNVELERRSWKWKVGVPLISLIIGAVLTGLVSTFNGYMTRTWETPCSIAPLH